MSKTNTLIYYVKNGLYIPFLHVALFYLTNNLFLSTIIATKLYPANYYISFYNHYQYRNLPKWVGTLKQFVRFTDTGHIASFIYFLYPEFFPIAFNIHFVITFGYWGSVLFFNMKDLDYRYSPEILINFAAIWSFNNNITPFVLFIREFWIQTDLCNNNNMFNMDNLFYSYKWIYCWLLFVYTPWRLITGDCVYTILSNNMSFKQIVTFILFLHNIFIAANITGALLQYIRC